MGKGYLSYNVQFELHIQSHNDSDSGPGEGGRTWKMEMKEHNPWFRLKEHNPCLDQSDRPTGLPAKTQN